MVKKTSNKRYTLSVYQRKNKIHSSQMTVPAPTKLTKLSKNSIKVIEQMVIDNGWVTTFAGVFGLIIDNETKEVMAMVTYRPTFNYHEFYDARKIYQETQLFAPGLKT